MGRNLPRQQCETNSRVPTVKVIDQLLNTNPFDFNEKNRDLFLLSLRECAAHHYENNAKFRHFWDMAKLKPEQIQSEEDVAKIPPLLVTLFKEFEWISCPKDEVVLTLGSSGTTGQRSIMHLDLPSLNRVKRAAYKIHESLGMTSDKDYHYLCFTYDPKVANDLGTAFTDELLTSFTGKKEVYYALQFDPTIKDFKLDKEAVAQKLIEYSKGQTPVRILGFPAFLYQIVEEFNLRLELPEDSWIQTGGGWKNHSDQVISKHEFAQVMYERLGIFPENIRDMFGMIEHGIPYVDFQDGEFRIPNYSRVLIRDPHSLELLPNGEVGLAQFICSYNSSYPVVSVLTTDWARVLSPNKNHPAKRLEIIGRAGVKKHRGCAITALKHLEVQS